MRSSISELVAAAALGQIVSFPTDTVPALAVRPAQASHIYQLKQRSANKPLILMAGQSDDIWEWVADSSDDRAIWQQLADRYWPGALTLVLPASEKLPSAMNLTGDNTIGVRVPNCEIARSILLQTGPLATTSANLADRPSLLTMAAIDRQFPSVYTLAMDSELAIAGIPSTVVKWTAAGWQVLRQGGLIPDIGNSTVL
jgi:L-threonylcarbamoyladenylate synthase